MFLKLLSLIILFSFSIQSMHNENNDFGKELPSLQKIEEENGARKPSDPLRWFIMHPKSFNNFHDNNLRDFALQNIRQMQNISSSSSIFVDIVISLDIHNKKSSKVRIRQLSEHYSSPAKPLIEDPD